MTLATLLNLAPAQHAAVVALMPTLGHELVELIGFEPTITLLHAHGGKRMFIKAVESPDGRLAQCLGAELTAKMSGHFGRDHLELPTLDRVKKLLRDNALRAAFDAGASVNDLMDRFGLSQRHVRKLLTASAATGL